MRIAAATNEFKILIRITRCASATVLGHVFL
jgi:hypothetical protein